MEDLNKLVNVCWVYLVGSVSYVVSSYNYRLCNIRGCMYPTGSYEFRDRKNISELHRFSSSNRKYRPGPWAPYQIRKIVGCAYAGNAEDVFPTTAVSKPDMHHNTCVTRVTWCIPGSLTSGFLWSWWRGKRSRRMRNPQICVSGKKPIVVIFSLFFLWHTFAAVIDGHGAVSYQVLYYVLGRRVRPFCLGWCFYH